LVPALEVVDPELGTKEFKELLAQNILVVEIAESWGSGINVKQERPDRNILL